MNPTKPVEPPPCIGISPGTMIPEGKRESVSHVMPEEVLEIIKCLKNHFQGDTKILLDKIRAAYQRIADLERRVETQGNNCCHYSKETTRLESEVTQLKSQLAAMKEAGEGLYDDVTYFTKGFENNNSVTNAQAAWKAATAALRQSGQGSTE